MYCSRDMVVIVSWLKVVEDVLEGGGLMRKHVTLFLLTKPEFDSLPRGWSLGRSRDLLVLSTLYRRQLLAIPLQLLVRCTTATHISM